MRFILSTAIVVVALSGYASAEAYAEAYPTAQVSQSQSNPSDGLSLKTPTYAGCYSNSGSLGDQGEYTYQAVGWCQPWCVRQNKPVMGFSNGTNCWCGDKLPPASDKVSDSECDIPCSGYDKANCGGLHAYAIWNDGILAQVDTDSTELYPTGATGTTGGSATSITVPSTVFVTAAGSTSAPVVYTTETAAPSSGPNKAAIAAGVVVSVVLVCAFVGGLMFWLRQKRRRELEEEHRRREKPHSSSSSSLPDSRLEPSVMFQRRQSDGSIADNQDYSRRILKVMNPDNRDSRVI
ncbi:hypothetical protein MMC30_001788 [Trapelia coarctata]|nr:hypothetical protein [Trapelia coarctata]